MRDVDALPPTLSCSDASIWLPPALTRTQAQPNANGMQRPPSNATTSSPATPADDLSCIAGSLLQRQVFIRDASAGQPLVYAASWWNKEEADRYLKDR